MSLYTESFYVLATNEMDSTTQYFYGPFYDQVIIYFSQSKLIAILLFSGLKEKGIYQYGEEDSQPEHKPFISKWNEMK